MTGSPSICGFVWNTTRWSWRIRTKKFWEPFFNTKSSWNRKFKDFVTLNLSATASMWIAYYQWIISMLTDEKGYVIWLLEKHEKVSQKSFFAKTFLFRIGLVKFFVFWVSTVVSSKKGSKVIRFMLILRLDSCLSCLWIMDRLIFHTWVNNSTWNDKKT